MIIPVETPEEAFKYVEQKKADLTLGSLIMSAYTIKENNFFNLKILNQLENYQNHFKIGIQKDDLELRNILNKAIQSITQEEITNIVNKWVAIKYEKDIDYTYLFIFLSLILVVIAFLSYRQYLLNHTNNYLQAEVKKRTAQVENSNLILNQKKDELHYLNKNLEIKVKDEIEKNRIIQERLYKADKLASMGEMISNIAHQWRQPLSVISTIATGTKLQKEVNSLKDEDLIENMDLINKNAQYLSKTIDDFRNFIKSEKIEEQLNLSVLFDNTLSIVGPNLKNNYIEFISNIDPTLEIKGYKNELIQAFINIINNSKDALISNNFIEEKYIFIEAEQIHDQCEIIIKDNGGGIILSVMNRIFEPYFTTKHQFQGTGLGLSIVHKIITELHEGTIAASNTTYLYNGKEYTGACFKIRF